MPGPARGVHDPQFAGGVAAKPGAGRTLPAPLLSLMGQLELEFVFFFEPLAPGVELPRADVGFDCFVAGRPERLDIHRHIHIAERIDRYVARRFWVHRPFNVRRALRRELTCSTPR